MNILKISKSLQDVIENPEDYEIEICATSLGLLKDINRKLYEYQKNLEARIIQEMEKDEATKLKYVNTIGEEMILTLKPGSMKQAVDNADEVIREHGFDPNEFGDYQYKLLTWSKLKNAEKLGGEIKKLINKLYVRGKKTLVIGENK